MFFSIPDAEFAALSPEVKVFLALAHGITNSVYITRSNVKDKEFPFQNWVQRRIEQAGFPVSTPGRHTYPDFTLKNFGCGFEVKGLSVKGKTGRWADFDCNSQLPLASHKGNKVYYIFGRYPVSKEEEYPVIDLVLCSAAFLNTEASNTNKNQSFNGYGSYGDIKVRDRRMFICKTPYGLATGTQGEMTLIVESGTTGIPDVLTPVGELERKEADKLVTGYSFDLLKNELKATSAPNEKGRTTHRFTAYKLADGPRTSVAMTVGKPIRII